MADEVHAQNVRDPPPPADTHRMARAMGLHEHVPTSAPCEVCGTPTTDTTVDALQATGQPKRFRIALASRCRRCQLLGGLQRTAERLADAELHPDARPRVEAAAAWYRAELAALDKPLARPEPDR